MLSSVLGIGLFGVLAYGAWWGVEFYRECLREATLPRWELVAHRIFLGLLILGGLGALAAAAVLLLLFNFPLDRPL